MDLKSRSDFKNGGSYIWGENYEVTNVPKLDLEESFEEELKEGYLKNKNKNDII